MESFFSWITPLLVVCIRLCHSLALNQSTCAASLGDEFFTDFQNGVSFLQVSARLRRAEGIHEDKRFRTSREDPQMAASCGRTSALQQNPESAIRIPEAVRDEYVLVQVQAVIRHGAPIEVKDTECPNLSGVQWNCSTLLPQMEAFTVGFNKNPGDCQYGQLLDWGYEQQVANGKALRAAYISSGILGTCPRVFSYSDDGAKLDYVRTAQSKEALLSAMFDGHNFSHIDQSSDYSIFFTDSNSGAPWDLKADSPGLLGDAYRYANSEMNLKMYEHWTSFNCAVEGVCNNVGSPINAATFQERLDTTMADANKYYKHTWMNGSVSQASIVSAEFVVNILAKLDAIGSTHAPQLVLWSSHDTVLCSLAVTLGLELEIWPPYAAVLLLEVWRNPATDVDFVRMLYQGEDVTQRLPACAAAASVEGLCPLQVLRKMLEAQLELIRSSGLLLRAPPQLNFSSKGCR